MKPARMFRSAAALAVVSLFVVAVAGCGSSPTAPSSSAVYTQVDMRIGTGATATNGSSLTVQYTGWFYDATQPNQQGLQFDTSVGGTGFTFVLGGGNVIAGWDQGVVGMLEGGVRRLVIPPSLAYGSSRNGPIPPDTTLVFEIELLSVNVVPTVTSQPSDQTVTAGQTATFTASASGSPAPTPQWQSSSDGGSTWSILTNAAPYSGVTTTTLTVSGTTTALSGTQYRAVFTNSSGTATTNVATLTVQ